MVPAVVVGLGVVSGTVYGPLAAPIAVLTWLYLVAIAVLIGAAVNAAVDTVFPQQALTRARGRRAAVSAPEPMA